MTRFVVVTGTDTDVGKTWVTEALARIASRDRRVVAIKPFESGARDGEGDGERLARATGQSAPTRALVRLKEPLTPALAAEREGVTIGWDALVADVRAYGAGADLVLVEGAGGVLSPLTWDHDVLHLARALDAAVLLVTSDRLGTISTTHAAVQVMLDGWQLPLGIVMSAPASPDASTGTNAGALRRRLAPYAAMKLVELPRDAPEAVAPVLTWIDAG